MTTERRQAKAEYDLARRLADPERKKAQSRAYYLANREKVITRARQWAIEHPEVIAQRATVRPEAWREYRRRYLANHPEENRVKAARYRARRRQASGNLTDADWADLLREFDHRCAYCNDDALLEIEHMTPLSRGGAHDRANVVPACRSCNRRKGGMTALEFLVRSHPSRKELQ